MSGSTTDTYKSCTYLQSIATFLVCIGTLFGLSHHLGNYYPSDSNGYIAWLIMVPLMLIFSVFGYALIGWGITKICGVSTTFRHHVLTVSLLLLISSIISTALFFGAFATLSADGYLEVQLYINFVLIFVMSYLQIKYSSAGSKRFAFIVAGVYFVLSLGVYSGLTSLYSGLYSPSVKILPDIFAARFLVNTPPPASKLEAVAVSIKEAVDKSKES